MATNNTPISSNADLSLYNANGIAHGRGEKFVRIPAEELRSLVVLAQQGDMKAKDKVCREVYRYVVKKVNAFRKRGVERVSADDLMQAGMLGVLRAIEGFEYDKGFSFMTYCTWWIDQSIDREFQNTSNTIRIPNHVYGSYRLLVKVYRETIGGRQADFDDFSLRVTEEELIQKALAYKDDTDAKAISRETLQSAFRYLFNGGNAFASIDQGVADDEGKEGKFLSSILVDPLDVGDTVERTVVEESDIAHVQSFLKYIDQRSRYVIMRRFGIGAEDEGLTLEAVGEELGVTRERVRQIEHKAVMMLKRFMLQCRELGVEELEEQAKRVYARRAPKPFSVPTQVFLTDTEKAILSNNIFGDMKPVSHSTGRVPLEGKRFKGRIVPPWFDPTKVRSTATRKGLKTDELNPEEIIVRYQMYGRTELPKDDLINHI